MPDEPLVSAIIPSYNRQHTIARAVKSVLDQTYKNLELLVVDDASTDETADVLASIDDARLTVISQPQNLGVAAARNRGIADARGEYLAFLDSDDEWLPDKLTSQLASMRASGAPEVFSCTNAYVVAGGDIRYLVNQAPLELETQLHTNCNLGPGSTLVLNRRCLEKTGPIDEAFACSMEDWDWLLRMAQCSTFVYSEQALANIYVGDGSRTLADVEKSTKLFLDKHQHSIAARGAKYRDSVVASHWMRLAQLFLETNDLAAGLKYLGESLKLKPLQDPRMPILAVSRLIENNIHIPLATWIEKYSCWKNQVTRDAERHVNG